MENIAMKTIGEWPQMIMTSSYYQEQVIDLGIGPKNVLVKVDYRTGCAHKPKTYYYKNEHNWSYGIIKFQDYWVVGELGDDENETCEMETEYGYIDAPSGYCWDFLESGHMDSYPYKAKTLADVLVLMGTSDEGTGELLPYATTGIFNRKTHEHILSNWDSILMRRGEHAREMWEEEILQRDGNIY